jgi:hypothetical protein
MDPATTDLATAAPYVAAGVALVVGVVNPWATNRLAARRQREQLDHDRSMRRREEIITLIGDATTAGSRRFYVTDRAMDLWRSTIAYDAPQSREVENERIAVVEQLRGAWGRIEVRFPQDSDVRQYFNEWRTALDAYSAMVRLGYEAGRPYLPEMMEVQERRRLAGQAADRWLEAARAAVAALDHGESSERG